MALPDQDRWSGAPVEADHELVARIDLVRRLIAGGMAETEAGYNSVDPATGLSKSVMHFDSANNTIRTPPFIDSRLGPGVALGSSYSASPQAEAIINTSQDPAVYIRRDQEVAGIQAPVHGGHWLATRHIMMPNKSGEVEVNEESGHYNTLINVLDKFLESAGVEYRTDGDHVIERPEWLAEADQTPIE